MRSPFWKSLVPSVLLLGFLAPTAVAQVEIGTVDVQRVRKENATFKSALSEIDAMVTDFEERRDQKQVELQQLSEDLQSAQDRNISASADRLRRDLTVKSQDFQQFMQETFGTDGIIETKSQELLEPAYTKLSDAAKAVATARSLDLILDLEQVNPLFVSDALDVTDAVLTEMAKNR